VADRVRLANWSYMFGPRRKIRYKIFKRWETCSRMEYYLRSPVQVLNSQGKTVGDNEMGSLAVKWAIFVIFHLLQSIEMSRLPLPPGAMSMMWRNDEKFVRTYFTKFPVEYCHCVLELR
jgi:hypothetical protein